MLHWQCMSCVGSNRSPAGAGACAPGCVVCVCACVHRGVEPWSGSRAIRPDSEQTLCKKASTARLSAWGPVVGRRPTLSVAVLVQNGKATAVWSACLVGRCKQSGQHQCRFECHQPAADEQSVCCLRALLWRLVMGVLASSVSSSVAGSPVGTHTYVGMHLRTHRHASSVGASSGKGASPTGQPRVYRRGRPRGDRVCVV